MLEEQFIAVGGNKLHVAIEGKAGAPWLTCLHALAANLHLWDAQAAAFGSSFRVLRIDTRGHGRSTVDHPASSMEDLVGDVAAVWDALGIERSLLVGLSLGGMIGIGLALQHPQRVTKLVAADCRADAPEFFVAMWRQRQQLLRDGGFDAVADVTLPIWFSEATRRDRPDLIALGRAMIVGTSVAGYVGASSALQKLDYKQRLPEIRCPTLLLVGALDGTHPAEMREMATLIPGVQFDEIAEAAHMSNLEQPGQFTEIVLEFLQA